MEPVLMLGELEDFVKLAKGRIACWWTISFDGYRATLYVYAEARSKEGGFVAYREVRRLDPTILDNLEKAHGVDFGDGDLAERYFSAACFLYSLFMDKLRRRGLRVTRGRYLYVLRSLTE